MSDRYSKGRARRMEQTERSIEVMRQMEPHRRELLSKHSVNTITTTQTERDLVDECIALRRANSDSHMRSLGWVVESPGVYRPGTGAVPAVKLEPVELTVYEREALDLEIRVVDERRLERALVQWRKYHPPKIEEPVPVRVEEQITETEAPTAKNRVKNWWKRWMTTGSR